MQNAEAILAWREATNHGAATSVACESAPQFRSAL